MSVAENSAADTARIRALVRDQLQEILYCEPHEIDDDRPFTEIGLDSVLGVELLAEVNREYGLHEKVRVLYSYPTVTELTQYLAGRASGALPEAGDPQ
ncbi:acyl carrier protein [Streptomyces sp. NPDC002520]